MIEFNLLLIIIGLGGASIFSCAHAAWSISHQIALAIGAAGAIVVAALVALLQSRRARDNDLAAALIVTICGTGVGWLLRTHTESPVGGGELGAACLLAPMLVLIGKISLSESR